MAGRDVLVAGSIGPRGAPTRDLHLDEADIRSTYRESIDGLLEGGVDLFWFETFSLIDLQSSWFGVRSVSPSTPAGSLHGSRSRSQPDPDVRA